MSRVRGGGSPAAMQTFHDGPGTPDFTSVSGTIAVNIYNDVFMQMDRPSGRNWVMIQEGYRPGIYVHNDMMPSSVARPAVISINGTALVDQAAATNIPADPNDTIALANYTTSGAGAGLARYPMGVGEDGIARFTSCILNIGGPFRILKMGVYCTDGNSCTTMQGKFGIYRAANHYNDNAMPWKAYPNATLYLSVSNPATDTKYTCTWDTNSVPPVIENEKFYVKSYWNNVGGSSGPNLLVRYALDTATGYKGDRWRTFSGGEAYATPNWTQEYDYTIGVGNQNGALSKSSVLFWFIVERV